MTNPRLLLLVSLLAAAITAIATAADDAPRERERSRPGGSDVRRRERVNPVATEFLAAAAAGDLAKLTTMLTADAALARASGDFGRTALHVAKTKAIVDALVAAGADINSRATVTKTSPLYEAATDNRGEVVAALLARGANVDLPAEVTRVSPLAAAARLGHREIVALLLEHKAAVNSRDMGGQTPLMAAAAEGRVNVIELLLARGAELNAVDNNKCTALDHAQAEAAGAPAIALLRARGAAAPDTERALFAAAGKADLETVRRLMPLVPDAISRRDARLGDTLLTNAARAGGTALVEFLLQQHPPPAIDAQDGRGYAAMHWAAYHGRADMISLLAAAGASLRLLDKEGLPPLLVAVREQQLSCVARLLELKADVAYADKEGRTALHLAATGAQPAITSALLAAGAPADARDSAGETALFVAVRFAKRDQMGVLLTARAGLDVPRADGLTPLLYLVRMNEHPELLPDLLRAGANVHAVDGTGGTALHYAVFHGAVPVAEALLAAGARINEAGNERQITPVHLAVERANTEMVSWLVAHGADVNAVMADGNTPLLLALAGQNVEMSKVLIESGARVDQRSADDAEPLHFAAAIDSVPIAELLLAAGASVRALATDQRATPLHVAVSNRSWEIVPWLLEHGADLEARMDDGATPLLLAAQLEGEDMGLLLLEKGASARAALANGATVLHLAVLPLVEAAVARGADVNAKTTDGATPLCLQAQHARLEVVEYLIARKVKLAERDAKGWTALDYATNDRVDKNGGSLETEDSLAAKQKIAELLKKNGVKPGRKT